MRAMCAKHTHRPFGQAAPVILLRHLVALPLRVLLSPGRMSCGDSKTCAVYAFGWPSERRFLGRRDLPLTHAAVAAGAAVQRNTRGNEQQRRRTRR